MSCWKKVRWRAEAFLCRAGFFIFPSLPHSWVRELARLTGFFAFYLAPSPRRVALANLKFALGGSFSESERNRIARAAFQSMARTGLETLAATRLAREGFEQHFEFAPGALELLRELVARKQGLIALTFHYGNWEWLSLAWGMAGYPATVVAQPIKNPHVEAMFDAARSQMSHRLIHRSQGRTAALLYRSLKRGEIIGLLVDLGSSEREGGGFFEFFGVPTMTTRAAGFLAMRTGAPVVCSVTVPQEDGRYRIEIGPEIKYDPFADPEKEGDAITRRWLAHCEGLIRKRPELWMWMYKRWKARATPEEGAYPFYSFYNPKKEELHHPTNLDASTCR